MAGMGLLWRRTGVRYSTDHRVGRHTRTGSDAGVPTPSWSSHRYYSQRRAMPANQPTPGAERRKFSFGKRPTGVRVALEMGFWEPDGQTRSEALQIAVEIWILLLISPSRCRTHWLRHRRGSKMEFKEGPGTAYILLLLLPSR